MAEHDITPEVTLSKTQRRLKVGYVGISHTNRKTKVSTRYSRSPSLHLKGDWLAEAGFDTGRGVTVKISEGCIVLMADNNEVRELREQLYQVRQVMKGIKEAVV
ncbi:SymE family type I addiction module toxin [Erwinia tracheiphila]|uniref:Type I addiction module toxin, SymE family n=1 Tax=Erwinia tracheiphila TaxID=65700 RepID=A0A345CUF7_9GAMM|nr:SymE family type I addiction module toxin [Erwinia tracheiphila]AXF77074.1 type I addiction module toxin, SymE family [Erwinia tracheiphila]AXF77080.1 type I addiction module toxin, SymE family [Erwinia tracheiphila]UIA84234.1 SymE family type I addiction module toxin [Erwinia tracheiphila]UIA84241.1 SymE family type I addiction module toxin [Erwinia tracheiphila]UIA92814.1 SymE family type I addiction module toxin [Erwinia tracheiphila]